VLEHRFILKNFLFFNQNIYRSIRFESLF